MTTDHSSPAAPPLTFRPDIEGLRALAVILVVVYHAHFGPFKGGLVGVDVFFVVSGFLITSLLLRERERTGSIALADFWARRVRRLLPASTLVVVATVIAARWMVPPILVEQVGRDALAAVGFVINLVFAHRANDYLGGQLLDAAPSPLLHFWSLAVEEQFYLVWPFVLWGLTRLGARLRTTATLIGILAAASLVACIVYTRTSPVWAFYLLPTRAWELLAGAALAVIGLRIGRVPGAVRGVLGWLGVGGIVLASLVISERTSFPGSAALLPVLSTVAVIAAGVAAPRWAPAALLSLRPLQWVGARSYAIYLWHWPALILAEARWGALDVWQRVLVVAVSLVLATLSHALVEDPVRHSRWIAARPLRSYAAGVSLLAVGLAAATITIASKPSVTGKVAVETPSLIATTTPTQPTSTATDLTSTSGPGTTEVAQTTAPIVPSTVPPTVDELLARIDPIVAEAVNTDIVPSNLTPPLSAGSAELPMPYFDGCLRENGETRAEACTYGDPRGTISIAIVGDSHAAQWQPALDSIGERRGWRIVFHGKRRCGAPAYDHISDPAVIRRECRTWRDNVVEALSNEPVDLVLLAAIRYPILDGINDDSVSAWQSGFETTATRLGATGAVVAILGDPPLPTEWPGACLSRHLESATECVIARRRGEPTRLVTAERTAAEGTQAHYLPTGDWFCSDERCAVIIGNINLYRDNNHLSIPAVLFFAPLLEASIDEVLGTMSR